jgi:Zn-dependent alcohol dehydrogenase
MLPLHPMELFDGRSISGTTFGDFKGKSQLPELAKACMNGVSLTRQISLLNVLEICSFASK